VRSMANKLFSFVWYFLKDTVGDVGEFFRYVTRKKTWVAIWGLTTIVSFIVSIVNKALGHVPDYRVTIFALFCFLLFYILYQWQIFSEGWTHQERERYIKKPNKEERK
jgi:hypothetical protein